MSTGGDACVRRPGSVERGEGGWVVEPERRPSAMGGGGGLADAVGSVDRDGRQRGVLVELRIDDPWVVLRGGHATTLQLLGSLRYRFTTSYATDSPPATLQIGDHATTASTGMSNGPAGAGSTERGVTG